jgi:hypothetical protein
MFNIHSTGELSQYIITGAVYNTARAPHDKVRHQAPLGLQCLDCMDFVICHQKAVAFDISGKNGSKFAGNLLVFRHLIAFIQVGLRV